MSKYLSAGKEGESYKEALALLIKIEEELAKFEVLEFSPENTCVGKPEGSRCWMMLTNQPECYFWNPILKKDGTVTWTGECSDGFAQGMGTLIHNYINWDDDSSMGRTKIEEIGQLQNGKKHGHWVESSTDSTTYKDSGNKYQSLSVAEGPYMEGKRHGYWVTHRDSTIYEEGAYVEGKKHGDWVHYFSDGSVVGKGSYVENRKHGDWVYYSLNGSVVAEGSYANDERSGNWVWYDWYGNVHSTEQTVGSGNSNPAGTFSQTQGGQAQGTMQQALQNLENVCGEKYQGNFADNDHYRFYCMAAFNDYCALKRAQSSDAINKLRASLQQNCAVLKSVGADSKCSYCK